MPRLVLEVDLSEDTPFYKWTAVVTHLNEGVSSSCGEDLVLSSEGENFQETKRLLSEEFSHIRENCDRMNKALGEI